MSLPTVSEAQQVGYFIAFWFVIMGVGTLAAIAILETAFSDLF